jgi:predicted TIM-barrel fold metal-dependent hydrolase
MREELMKTTEAPLEPELPIIDAHHHLWDSAPPGAPFPPFPIETLIAERKAAAHNIRASVFVDCRWSYLTTGPPEYRPIGETRAVEAAAASAEAAGEHGLAAGIVSHVDMTLGDGVEPVLQAHLAESPSRFRGVRQVTPWHQGVKFFGSEGQKETLRSPQFLASVAKLGALGLTFDAYVLFPQLSDVAYLAQRSPGTTIILNHVGAPRSIPGIPDAEADEIWRRGLAEVAACPNVVVKLGGLLMHHHGSDASGSEAAAAAMRHHLLTAIDLFSPERCLFESNFPVDGVAIPYGHLWNAFKRVTADFTSAEREALFWRTAARVYRIEI